MEEGALELCRKFDKDGNGYLSKSEIREAVGNSLTKKEIDDLLERADTNHDGKVDYEGEKRGVVEYQCDGSLCLILRIF